MKQTIIFSIGIALILGSMGLRLLPRADAESESRTLKVGIIDVKGVFDSYPKKQALEKQMADENKRLNEEARSKQEELQKLQRDMEFYTEGSDERQKAEADFHRKESEFKVFVDESARRLEREYRKSIATLYADISDVIQTYGREQQFDLILKMDKPDLTAGNSRELQFQINNHKLLYGDARLDITSDIAALLAEKTR